MLATALLVLSLLRGDPASGATTVARVSAGDARALVGDTVLVLVPRTGARELAGAAWLETAPRSTLELAWRGRASARIEGAAELAVTADAVLTLDRYEVVELEVRRGGLALDLPGVGRLRVADGAVCLRTLPGGLHEVHNRGGSPLEIGGVTVEPGARVRLRGKR